MTFALPDGTVCGIGYGRPGAPPDRPEWMAPASSWLWLRVGGGWWQTTACRRKLAVELGQCDTWAEVVEYGVVFGEPVEVRHEPPA